MKQILVAFKDGKKVAESPLINMTAYDVEIILRHWETIGRTWEYQEREVTNDEK